MNKSFHEPENGDLIPFDTAGERLLGDIRVLIKSVRARLAQTTNTMLVTLYWNIGRCIKFDIPGNERAPYGKEIIYALTRQLTAEYGKQIVQTLSGQLTAEYGRGFRFRNLWMIRKFYLTYKNLNALRAELSWTHYRMLIQINDSDKSSFYKIECVANNWSIRELDRQINSMIFERLPLRKDKQGVLNLGLRL